MFLIILKGRGLMYMIQHYQKQNDLLQVVYNLNQHQDGAQYAGSLAFIYPFLT